MMSSRDSTSTTRRVIEMSDEPELPDDVETVLDGCVAVLEAWREQATVEEIRVTHHDPAGLDGDVVRTESNVYVVASSVAKAAGEEVEATVLAAGADHIAVRTEDVRVTIEVRDVGLPLHLVVHRGNEEIEFESDCVGAELELRYQIASELDVDDEVGDSRE